jgi:hypothetical protein
MVAEQRRKCSPTKYHDVLCLVDLKITSLGFKQSADSQLVEVYLDQRFSMRRVEYVTIPYITE